MSKAKLSATEWELVRNAPFWVNQALAKADGRQSLLARRRENKAFEKAIEEYKSSNALIRDIIADDGDAAKEVGKGSQADAEAALSRIAAIVQEKLGDDDLKELSAFLKQVGHSVASATKEGGRGNSGVVSEKESAALARVESVMKVSTSYTTAHVASEAAAKPTATTKPAPKPAAKPSASAKPAPATRDDDKKAEQEKKLAEARERQEKARAEAEANRKEAEAKERLEKARKETEERQAAAAAEREAKAKAEAEAQAKAEAAASPYREFIAEHTVVAGDNLSFISQRYYGTQANFRIIYEANRDVIGDNMNLIKPGQKLRIPKL